jgi:hypothetical protein
VNVSILIISLLEFDVKRKNVLWFHERALCRNISLKNLKIISLPCPFNKFEYMQGLCDYLCSCMRISVCLWTYIFNFRGVKSAIKSKHGPRWVFISSHKDFSLGRVCYIWVFISSHCLKS